MKLKELLPEPMPSFYEIGGFEFLFSQTLITSFLATVTFAVFVLIYNLLKSRNSENIFVSMVDVIIESLKNFFESIGGTLSSKINIGIVFVFFYIAWINIFSAIGDLFALSIPALHDIFRPIASDVTFNLVLAIFFVCWAIGFGFYKHGFKFIEKYVPVKGIGLVEEVRGVGSFFVKAFDIMLGLFTGFLEFLGELTKMLSLSLRLFGNILAGAVLFVLIFAVTELIFKWAILLPLIVLVMELFVGILQAFIFALLVLVYFKMAESGH